MIQTPDGKIMFCTKCGHANRDTAKFCAQCGAELLRRTVAAPDAPAPAPAPLSAPEPVTDTPPPAAASRAETNTAPAAASSATPASAISSSRNAIVLGSVVLVCVLAAATTWILTRNKAPEAATPLAEEAAVQTQTASAPEAAPEPAPLPPAPTPESLPPAPGLPVKPAVAKPVVLSEAEVKRLVARLQQEPAPFSCQGAAQRIRTDYNTGPAQAGDIAKRAYPQLCSPTSAAPAATTSSQPENRSIDQLYEERAAAECAKGFSGLVCREILHNKLCNGRWSANPPAGQSRCLRAESTDNN